MRRRHGSVRRGARWREGLSRRRGKSSNSGGKCGGGEAGGLRLWQRALPHRRCVHHIRSSPTSDVRIVQEGRCAYKPTQAAVGIRAFRRQFGGVTRAERHLHALLCERLLAHLHIVVHATTHSRFLRRVSEQRSGEGSIRTHRAVAAPVIRLLAACLRDCALSLLEILRGDAMLHELLLREQLQRVERVRQGHLCSGGALAELLDTSVRLCAASNETRVQLLHGPQQVRLRRGTPVSMEAVSQLLKALRQRHGLLAVGRHGRLTRHSLYVGMTGTCNRRQERRARLTSVMAMAEWVIRGGTG